MKKRLPISIIAMFFVFNMFISEADALGLGGYGQFGLGVNSGTIDGANDDYAYDFDADMAILGLGFVLDTTVARDSLFNYRLQIGYENVAYKLDHERWGKSDIALNGLAITNDLGFGVLRTNFMRLWLGPEIRLSYGLGSMDEGPRQYDIYFMGLGIGPVVGANFHIGQSLTLAAKLSYLLEGYLGAGTYEGDYDFDDEVYTASGSTIYLNFSVLFRLGDTY